MVGVLNGEIIIMCKLEVVFVFMIMWIKNSISISLDCNRVKLMFNGNL